MQYLKDEIRESILLAATNEFYKKGYKEASMRDIAKNAGMTVGNLYRYFKNKDELFDQIVREVEERLMQTINHDLKVEKTNRGSEYEIIAYHIKEMANVFVNMYKKHPKVLTIIFKSSEGSKHELFKDKLIKIVEDHMIECGNSYFGIDYLEPIVIHILAKVEVEGYITILESDLSNKDKEIALFQLSRAVFPFKRR